MSGDFVVIYRRATVGDEAEIANVHTHAWQESYRGIIPDKILDDRPLSFRNRLRWVRSVLEGKEEGLSSVFVAEHATHGIVAFCTYGRGREKDRTDEGEVMAFYMLNQFKRRGVGRRLFAMAQDDLRKQGFQKMHVSVLTENPAVKFYEAVGGRLVTSDRKITIGIELQDSLYEWDL